MRDRDVDVDRSEERFQLDVEIEKPNDEKDSSTMIVSYDIQGKILHGSETVMTVTRLAIFWVRSI